MPRLNEERDGDYDEYAGTGTGSHWDRACESVPGDHEAGTERLNCNVETGTGSGTERTRQEIWSADSALAAFPPEEGWIHEDKGPCECCGVSTTCCDTTIATQIPITVASSCGSLDGLEGIAVYDVTNEWWEIVIDTGCADCRYLRIQVFCDINADPDAWSVAFNFEQTIGGIVCIALIDEGDEPDFTGTCNPFVVTGTWPAITVTGHTCCTSPFSLTITAQYERWWCVETAPDTFECQESEAQPPNSTGPFPTEVTCSAACGNGKWWCVKQGTIGNRRVCQQEVTEAYDGPYNSQEDCESACEEPDAWCVEWQDEDEESNPIGRPYVTCEVLGTGDELGQILNEGTRTGIVVGGPWNSENCALACPPCGGDYAS